MMTTTTELIARARAQGIRLSVQAGHLRVRSARPLTESELDALREHKGMILAVLDPVPVLEAQSAIVWPPEDAADLVSQWEALGRLPVPIAPWLTIADLGKYFNSVPVGIEAGPGYEPADIEAIRRFLQ